MTNTKCTNDTDLSDLKVGDTLIIQFIDKPVDEMKEEIETLKHYINAGLFSTDQPSALDAILVSRHWKYIKDRTIKVIVNQDFNTIDDLTEINDFMCNSLESLEFVTKPTPILDINCLNSRNFNFLFKKDSSEAIDHMMFLLNHGELHIDKANNPNFSGFVPGIMYTGKMTRYPNESEWLTFEDKVMPGLIYLSEIDHDSPYFIDPSESDVSTRLDELSSGSRMSDISEMFEKLKLGLKILFSIK